MKNNCEEGGVGPYWFVRDKRGAVVLLSHICPLDRAEKYGHFLTCPHGHYEIWEGWRVGRPPEVSVSAVIRDCEYEEWPRGRVVFDESRNRFIVYADGQILGQQMLQRHVLERFHIRAEAAEFSRDEHYVSTCRLFGD